MNVMEAVRTGLPFKRENDQDWIILTSYAHAYNDRRVVDGLLADDWIIQNQVTITADALECALREALHFGGYPVLEGIEAIILDLNTKLGLHNVGSK